MNPVRVRTHASLCAIAARWLRRSHSAGGHGCQVAFTELQSDGENADAIGFRAVGSCDGSVVVECKTTRGDFLADARSPQRTEPSAGLGRWRYYLAPEGLIDVAELPPGWGLLEVSDRGSLLVRAGAAAVLAKHSGSLALQRTFTSECERWALRPHVEREQALLTRLLARASDPEAASPALREANSRLARLSAEIAKLHQEKKQLEDRLLAQSGRSLSLPSQLRA
ncbi:MAG: hypothetical protein A2X76_01280 [Lysobacterales bacterium GWF1_69_6]|nr:MAG: hypothetical protein A2X76_01280 [Xanthomonadales bacterium GWF1_69_6]